jgi:hypothetical protein
LFKERDFTKEKDIRISPNYIANHMNKRLNLTLIAFILAEAMLYTIWYYEKNTGLNFVWPETMNYANMFGVASILLYNRLPHLSILTLLYTMGFGIFLVAVITCSTGGDSCKTSTLSAVSNICVLSGMILPFITESTIKMFGKRNKALASAILNLCIKMASSIGTLLLIWTNPSPIRIMCITVILLLTAAIFQKIAEKEPSLHAD